MKGRGGGGRRKEMGQKNQISILINFTIKKGSE